MLVHVSKAHKQDQRTIGPILLTWVHRICWTSLEIQDYMLYKLSPMQKKKKKQIWPCHKNCHGQPIVIIWKIQAPENTDDNILKF